MSTLKEMCYLVYPYTCHYCGSNNLYFYTKYNDLINYKSFIDNNLTLDQIKDNLYDKNIKYLKCLSCNKISIIDWSNGYPKQLYDKNAIKKFGIQV